jgi:hypothetical protein
MAIKVRDSYSGGNTDLSENAAAQSDVHLPEGRARKDRDVP